MDAVIASSEYRSWLYVAPPPPIVASARDPRHHTATSVRLTARHLLTGAVETNEVAMETIHDPRISARLLHLAVAVLRSDTPLMAADMVNIHVKLMQMTSEMGSLSQVL